MRAHGSSTFRAKRRPETISSDATMLPFSPAGILNVFFNGLLSSLGIEIILITQQQKWEQKSISGRNTNSFLEFLLVLSGMHATRAQ